MVTGGAADPGGWECEAYGPGGREMGAACFIAGAPGVRVCATAADCARVCAAERVRIWDRMTYLAAHGEADERALWASILGEISGPDDLLRGDGPGS